jgi:hypothetical protein
MDVYRLISKLPLGRGLTFTYSLSFLVFDIVCIVPTPVKISSSRKPWPSRTDILCRSRSNSGGHFFLLLYSWTSS